MTWITESYVTDPILVSSRLKLVWCASMFLWKSAIPESRRRQEGERQRRSEAEEEGEKFILSPLKEMWIIWLLFFLAKFKRLQRSSRSSL